LGDGGGEFGLLGFDAAPAYGAAMQGFLEGAEKDDVHHLTIIEALDEKRREKRPVFVFFEGEGDDAGEQVDEHESGEENERANDVVAGPEQGEMRDAELRESPEKNRKQEKKIDDGRDERQQNLKQENVGQSDPAERAVTRAADGVAMFPDGLQSAESPAEALANQTLDRVGDFGVADGVFVVENFPAVAANGEGEVGVFRDSVSRETSARAHDLRAPGSHRSGDDGNAIQQIESALFEILAGDVFERLPARKPAIAVHDFHVSGDGADARVGKMADQARNGIGIDDGVGVNGDDDFARASERA